MMYVFFILFLGLVIISLIERCLERMITNKYTMSVCDYHYVYMRRVATKEHQCLETVNIVKTI